MRYRPSPGVVAVALGIVGTLLLGWVASHAEPSSIPLSELPDYEDRTVQVKGTVVDSHSTRAGGWILTLDDGSAIARVFVPRLDFAPRVGDVVRAVGESQRYEGEWEVICANYGVVMVRPWYAAGPDITALALEPAAWDGLNLNLTATVTSAPNTYDGTTYLYVGDGNHSLRVVADDGKVPVLLEGERVQVRGLFEYDDYGLRYQMRLEDEIHGVWLAE